MWLRNNDFLYVTSYFFALFLPSISWKVIEKLLAFCVLEENSWEQEDLRRVLNGLWLLKRYLQGLYISHNIHCTWLIRLDWS